MRLAMRISCDAQELYKKGEKEREKIAEAVKSAAYIIRNQAVTNLTDSPYRMSKVAHQGIRVGALKKDKDATKTKVHAMGSEGEGYLARIFVPGTRPRHNLEGKRCGYIKPNPAIDRAADPSILESEIKKRI